MTKIHGAAYSLLAVLAGLSYWSMRGFVVAQESSDERIVVSNLTLTLVLFVLGFGALAPMVTKRVFPKARRKMLIPVAVAMGILLILVLRTLGVNMRF